MKNHFEKGQTVIEAMIALALIVVVLGAITVTVLTGLNNTQFIKNQTLASKYSQDGMEYIRYLINNDPNEIYRLSEGTGVNTYCYNIPGTGETFSAVACPSQPNILGTFIRSAQFESQDETCGDGIKITVSVKWASGKCAETNRYCHNSELTSCVPKEPPAPEL